MYLHRSNRAEVLVAKLAEVVKSPAGGPFACECIAVQGKGMERWLSMELAKRHGVWANPDFPFARELVTRAYAAVLPEQGACSWETSTLTWAIAEGLERMQARSGLPPYAPTSQRTVGAESSCNSLSALPPCSMVTPSIGPSYWRIGNNSEVKTGKRSFGKRSPRSTPSRMLARCRRLSLRS